MWALALEEILGLLCELCVLCGELFSTYPKSVRHSTSRNPPVRDSRFAQAHVSPPSHFAQRSVRFSRTVVPHSPSLRSSSQLLLPPPGFSLSFPKSPQSNSPPPASPRQEPIAAPAHRSPAPPAPALHRLTAAPPISAPPVRPVAHRSSTLLPLPRAPPRPISPAKAFPVPPHHAPCDPCSSNSAARSPSPAQSPRPHSSPTPHSPPSQTQCNGWR